MEVLERTDRPREAWAGRIHTGHLLAAAQARKDQLEEVQTNLLWAQQPVLQAVVVVHYKQKQKTEVQLRSQAQQPGEEEVGNKLAAEGADPSHKDC